MFRCLTYMTFCYYQPMADPVIELVPSDFIFHFGTQFCKPVKCPHVCGLKKLSFSSHCGRLCNCGYWKCEAVLLWFPFPISIIKYPRIINLIMLFNIDKPKLYKYLVVSAWPQVVRAGRSPGSGRSAHSRPVDRLSPSYGDSREILAKGENRIRK